MKLAKNHTDVDAGRRTPELSYVICATPRSGSTLLCEALRATGVAGSPGEHFEFLLDTGLPKRPRDYFQRSDDPEVWALLDDLEFRELLGKHGGWYGEEGDTKADKAPDFEALRRRALREGTTENGVFGTKIMWAYFRDFVRLALRTPEGAGMTPYEAPAAVLPNMNGYIWIRRGDTVRQAVSLWKALQTQQWRADHEGGMSGQAARRELRFHFAAVDHLRLRIDEHNAAWQSFLERSGANYVGVVYEELIEDYERTMRRVMSAMGLPLPEYLGPEHLGMRRQADALSEEWVRLYHEGNRERSSRSLSLAGA